MKSRCYDAAGALRASEIPSTFFTETAVFSADHDPQRLSEPSKNPMAGPQGQVNESASTAPSGPQESTRPTTSYFKKSSALQRRQPTFKAMRAFIQERRTANMSAPTLAQAREAFPGASSVMVRRMFENISVSVPLEELFENIMAADMTKLCYPSDEFLHDPHRKGKPSPNLTIRSRQLCGSMPISQMGKYPRNFCSLEVAPLSNLKTGLAKPLPHLPSFPARPAVAPPARSLIHLHNRLVNCLTAQLPGHLPSRLVGRPWQL